MKQSYKDIPVTTSIHSATLRPILVSRIKDITTGYKKDYGKWERPIKYKYVEHAERNAIYNASRHGTPLENSIAIVTMFPCSECTRALIQSGIKTIISTYDLSKQERWGYEWEISNNMFKEAGINVIILSDEEINKHINVTIETI